MSKRELGKHFIREWRKYRGLSLRRLAERMETEPGELLTSHANIQRIEKYEQPYTQEILEALAEALEVSPTDLLSVDPSKNGEVVDLLRLINDKNRAQALRVLKALTG
jgi:transcriptional regulator with XRE-family HTH domain